MTISNQASNNIDETIDWAAMASMLDLGDILELLDDTFNDGPFSEEQFVEPR